MNQDDEAATPLCASDQAVAAVNHYDEAATPYQHLLLSSVDFSYFQRCQHLLMRYVESAFEVVGFPFATSPEEILLDYNCHLHRIKSLQQ